MITVSALLAATYMFVVACSQAKTPTDTLSPAVPPTSPRLASPASEPSARIGSPANPLVLSCADAALPGDSSIPHQPRPADLAIGPLFIPYGKRLANLTPSAYGYSKYGRAGRSYKIPLFLEPGSTVTVTIVGVARGHVVIDSPTAHSRGVGGLTSATYHSCARRTAAFAQGFAFTGPPFRGCVPLDIAIGRRVHHFILSLFVGEC